ncbi:hypothetical protein E3N88_00607 [Mikania micrantha]|uniref:Uncharacterized protein n=1 Tax=Mikania micrantha TaxID=192012 RepID=A0A5N6Q0H5_9ASTR|nr:hypothetical protein E3N88_00607 [Mikania micrantha]
MDAFVETQLFNDYDTEEIVVSDHERTEGPTLGLVSADKEHTQDYERSGPERDRVHASPLVDYFLQDYTYEINKLNPLGIVKPGEGTRFLTPLVTFLEGARNGADIELAVNRFLGPMKKKVFFFSTSRSEGIKVNGSVSEATEESTSDCQLDTEVGDLFGDKELEETYSNELSLRLCIMDDRGMSGKSISKISVVNPSKIVKVILDWTDKDHGLYDSNYLKDLPMIHKPGLIQTSQFGGTEVSGKSPHEQLVDNHDPAVLGGCIASALLVGEDPTQDVEIAKCIMNLVTSSDKFSSVLGSSETTSVDVKLTEEKNQSTGEKWSPVSSLVAPHRQVVDYSLEFSYILRRLA